MKATRQIASVRIHPNNGQNARNEVLSNHWTRTHSCPSFAGTVPNDPQHLKPQNYRYSPNTVGIWIKVHSKESALQHIPRLEKRTFEVLAVQFFPLEECRPDVFRRRFQLVFLFVQTPFSPRESVNGRMEGHREEAKKISLVCYKVNLSRDTTQHIVKRQLPTPPSGSSNPWICIPDKKRISKPVDNSSYQQGA